MKNNLQLKIGVGYDFHSIYITCHVSKNVILINKLLKKYLRQVYMQRLLIKEFNLFFML